MNYILNTLIVPIDFDSYPSVNITLRRISIDEAKKLLRLYYFTSAVGHEGTAKVLSNLLGVEIPVNRTSVFMKRGDRALHFFLKQRLPEGKILTEDELKNLQFWFVISEVKEP